jgi:coenzyme F420-reducing hydrogenase beta subunit
MVKLDKEALVCSRERVSDSDGVYKCCLCGETVYVCDLSLADRQKVCDVCVREKDLLQGNEIKVSDETIERLEKYFNKKFTREELEALARNALRRRRGGFIGG